MQRNEADLEPEEAPIPCDCCGAPAECGIWEHPVCYRCASDWYAKSPTYGDIAKKYGNDDDSVRIYTEWTAKWVKAHRRALAAPLANEVGPVEQVGGVGP